MEYEITIINREANPNYKPFEGGRPYENYNMDNRNENERQQFLNRNVMSTVLNEKQFRAVQKAVLETFSE